jgi:protein-tyrosine phosphatase
MSEQRAHKDEPWDWLWRYAQTEWRRFFGLNVSPVNPRLFVGGQFRPEQWPALYALGIRAVLSLQAEYVDRFSGPPPERTLRLHVVDHTAPTLEQLAEGVAFVAAAHADELPVLVHCHAGIGRAPIPAAAYLMAHHGMGLESALQTIRYARPVIAPNPRQRQRLREWEQQLGMVY